MTRRVTSDAAAPFTMKVTVKAGRHRRISGFGFRISPYGAADDRRGAQSTDPAPCPTGDRAVRRRPGTRGAVGAAGDSHHRRPAAASAAALRGPPPVPAHCPIAARRAGDDAGHGRRPRREVVQAAHQVHLRADSRRRDRAAALPLVEPAVHGEVFCGGRRGDRVRQAGSAQAAHDGPSGDRSHRRRRGETSSTSTA